ncbi:MAG: metal ABC transporter substrate-binding protein [Lachnospiraceae bacterium]|nr:metal ABC transporter substrate-binding protein [Lachnospiraceae bacterium]
MKSHFFLSNKLRRYFLCKKNRIVRRIFFQAGRVAAVCLLFICMTTLCGCGKNTQGDIGAQGDTGVQGDADAPDHAGTQNHVNEEIMAGESREFSEKPVIVCTLFPQYDFARTVFGSQAKVVMLLSPGMESHMYDPTPEDMVTISEADAFIYTGDEMEPWAAQIVESLDGVTILDLSEHVNLQMEDEEGHDHEDEHHHHGEHEHSYDPHFWLDMDNAVAMLDAIEKLALDMGIENADLVTDAAKTYREKLTALDEAYFDALEGADHRDIVFAGRFAYGYFVHRYDLSYETVYHSCSAEADPSVSDMTRVIDYIKEHGTKVIFYEELSNASVAKTIAADTGVQIRMLSTAHNVTKTEFEAGITFYDIMKNNLEVVKEALGVGQ